LPAHRSASTSSREMTDVEFELNRQFVTTTQGRIAYLEQGRGEALLLLHGFPLNSFQWRGVVPRLSAHRRCLAPDFLALGYTEVAGRPRVTPHAQGTVAMAVLGKLLVFPR